MSISKSYPWVSVCVIVLACGYFAVRYSLGLRVFQFNPQVFPVQAVDWLETHPIDGNMFNEFNWGGYLLYRLWPRDLVFLDSQSDFYGESLMIKYENIYLARENWRDLLETYSVDWVLVPVSSPLVKSLSSDIHWALAYRDSVAIILYRR